MCSCPKNERKQFQCIRSSDDMPMRGLLPVLKSCLGVALKLNISRLVCILTVGGATQG